MITHVAHTYDESTGLLAEQNGVERLAAYRYPARLIDKCDIHHADECPSKLKLDAQP